MTKMNYFPLPEEVRDIPLDDYTGALAFSGGVESTALMSWLKSKGEKFVAFNLSISLPKPPYGPIEIWLATQRINAKKIAEKMDVPLIELDMQMTNLNTVRPEQPNYTGYSFQRWYIGWYLGLLTVYNPGIENLYYGLNNEDTSAIDPVMRAKLESVITIMAGKNKLKSPLDHLSKKEQWDLIPPDVQPLVLTCYNKVCGICFKCLERINAGIPLE
jgi:7-cyano-7-deazaguanine synthase in queuosine biosynthesis